MSGTSLTFITITVIIVGVAFFLFRGEQFALPGGETVPLSGSEDVDGGEISDAGVIDSVTAGENEIDGAPAATAFPPSRRDVFITDGVKHSIPLGEILSGGPPKDGIPSIDDPKFISTKEADSFLDADSVGLGLEYRGETRFYPYAILVWHEIVNDTVAGDPVLVTYCPLCATAIVFDRRVGGITEEFGVSGKLWRSNLLMYNRAERESDESLWSQVLGEAVLGPETGTRLALVPADTVRYGDWKQKHPDTAVLSRETGTRRDYGRDPYGNYYTDESVGFGATFSDTRLHPKEFVLGIEVSGMYKAYQVAALPTGVTDDTFAGERIEIEKSEIGEVRIFLLKDGNRTPLPHIGGFWFSWLAAHPGTELFSK